MAGFKVPTFQERADQAQAHREKALKKLAAKKPMDPEEVARRKAKQEERAAAAAEKSAARKAAIAEAKAEKEAAANVPEPTEAELKEARDAKYAARKKRKKG
ncbi:DUF6481 family protein [Alteriqipengyuania sp. 357]